MRNVPVGRDRSQDQNEAKKANKCRNQNTAVHNRLRIPDYGAPASGSQALRPNACAPATVRPAPSAHFWGGQYAPGRRAQEDTGEHGGTLPASRTLGKTWHRTDCGRSEFGSRDRARRISCRWPVRLRRARCRVGTPARKIHAKTIVTRKLSEQPGRPSRLTAGGLIERCNVRQSAPDHVHRSHNAQHLGLADLSL